MNCIVICMDTLRWDHLGCYQPGRIQTPQIDAFARDATRFDAAYCASFPTIPMRTDAFTGNVNWPVYGWKSLDEDEITIPRYLRDAGYHTAFIHDTGNMEAAGFARDFDENVFLQPPAGWEDRIGEVQFPVPREHLRQDGSLFVRDRAATLHYEHEEDWAVARTMRAACSWLEDNRKRERFLLWIDTFEIHEDWRAPEYYTEYYSPHYEGLDYSYPNYGYTDIYQPHELARLQAHYAAEVTLTDRWVGQVLRSLELMGLYHNTMVILLSDHGMYLGEHRRTGKHTVDPEDPWPIYDEVGRIPLLIRHPAGGPRRSTALVQAADVAPTILESCGADLPAMVGRSLLPVLRDHSDLVHEHVFTSCHSGSGPGRINYLPSCITTTDAVWSLVTGPESWQPALHHRPTDPRQEHNVIGEYPQVVDRLQEALVTFMRGRGADEDYVRSYTSV